MKRCERSCQAAPLLNRHCAQITIPKMPKANKGIQTGGVLTQGVVSNLIALRNCQEAGLFPFQRERVSKSSATGTRM